MLDAEYTVYRPRRLRLRTWLMLIVVLLISWSLASYWTEYRQEAARRARETMAPGIGAYCKVVLHSAAVGIESAGTRAAEINGAPNYLSGNFVRMNDQWIVLRTGEKDRWISREQVLFMEVGSP